MSPRLVVHMRWCPPVDPDESLDVRSEQWAALVGQLADRAIALGGRVIAWGHEAVTVDFAWDGLYDAIDFLVDAPLAPELASGFADGEVKVVLAGSRASLAVGAVVGRAEHLADAARPGEVLVDPGLVRGSQGRIGTVGEPGKRPGRPTVDAVILDPERPLRESLIPRAENGSEGEPSSVPPLSLRGVQLEKMTAASQTFADSLFPAAMTKALERRDAQSLRELAESVRSESGGDVAERLDAMAELLSGRSGEALRRLRHAKDEAAVRGGSALCRAALALAVALSTSGRPYEAILEALEGLARAREAGDARGELASSRFLSQLATSLGDYASADVWARVAS